MDVKEISEDQLIRELRAEYRRMETKLHEVHRTLAALLWQHGPMGINPNDVPTGLIVNTKQQSRRLVLSATLPRRVIAHL